MSLRPRNIDPETADLDRLTAVERFISRTLPGLLKKRVAFPGNIAPTAISSVGVRATTVTNGPQAVSIDVNGVMGIAASTAAKKNISGPYNVDMSKFLAIVLKSWSYKDSPDSVGMGPIADDLDAAGLKEFVIYNLDGSIQGIKNEYLLIGLWSAYTQSRATTLARIAKQAHQVVTVSSMAALAVGGTTTYPITWPNPFADNDYMVTASVTNTSGIAVAGTVASVVQSSKTTTGCTISVASGVVLLAGQTLTVEALHV